MPQLTLEAKDEIRKHLEKRDRTLALFGAAGLVSVLGLIGGFLVYVLDDLRVRGELAARATIESIRLTEFQPELADLRDQIRQTQRNFDTEARRLSSLANTIDTYKGEIEELSDRAEQALQDLNKAQGSLLFADKILEIRQDILDIQSYQKSSPDPESANVLHSTPLSDFLENETSK